MGVDVDNRISETNEGDNSNTGELIDWDGVEITDPNKIDLSAVAFNVVQEPLSPGDSFGVEYQIQNTENLDAGEFLVNIYLSADGTIDSEDLLLGSETIGGLAGNSQTDLLTGSYSLPAADHPIWNDSNLYTIGMMVDGANGVTESNEDNNANLSEYVDADSVRITIPIAEAPVEPVEPPTRPQFPRENQPLIAVIDTGFAADNPDLDYSRLVLGRDRIDNDNDPMLTGSGDEHGTHVLGIIGATQDNGIGIDGVNDDAPIWLGRAIGSGDWAASLIEFVDYARSSGQPHAIANISFDLTQVNRNGSVTTRYELTPEERQALGYARQHGVLIVVAAGNDAGVMSVLGQASQEFDNIITVGAADGSNRAVYSSYGNGLNILAGGGTTENPVLSLVGDGVGTMAGTSVAAAQVTGAASLVWAANPDLNYRQVIEAITGSATDLQASGWDAETGAGLLNVDEAVETAENMRGTTYNPEAFLVPTTWGGAGEVMPGERAVRNYYEGTIRGREEHYGTLYSGRDDKYYFSLDESSIFQFSLNFDGVVQVYRSSGGGIIAYGRAQGSGKYGAAYLNSGDYYVRISQYDGQYANQSYKLVTNVDQATFSSRDISYPYYSGPSLGDRDLGTLRSRETIRDYLGFNDSKDTYDFRLSESSELDVSLSGSGVYYRLESSSGRRYYDGSTLPAGNYSIDITGGSSGSGSNYTLKLDPTPVVTDTDGTRWDARYLGYLDNDYESRRDSIGGGDDNDYYKFRLDYDSDFELDLTNLRSDADVQVLSSGGSTIFSSRRGGSSSESIDGSLTSGTYYVRVYNYNSRTDYNLRLEATTSDPDGELSKATYVGRLNGGSARFNDSIGYNGDENDYYRFYLSNSSDFELSLTNLRDGADVRLLNSSGSTIERGTRSGTSNEYISESLSSGNYYVRVYPDGSNDRTSYSLNMSATDNSIRINGYTVEGDFFPVFNDNRSRLNNPTSNALYSSGNRYQSFQKGMIAQSQYGTLPVYGDIYQEYNSLGGVSSWLGVPRVGQLQQGNGFVKQDFQNGYVIWNGVNSVAYQVGRGTPQYTAPGSTPSGVRDINNNDGYFTGRHEYSGSVNSSDRYDYYRFTVDELSDFNQHYLRFAVRDNNGNDISKSQADIKLLDRNWNNVGLSESWRPGVGPAGAALDGGTYYVAVEKKGSGTTNYDLVMHLDSARQDLTSARHLGNFSGRHEFYDFVGIGDDYDYYRLDVDEPSFLRFSLRDGQGDVDLLDSNGTLLTSGNSNDDGHHDLDDGSYYLRVKPVGDINSNYKLTLQMAEDFGNFTGRKEYKNRYLGFSYPEDFYRFSLDRPGDLHLALRDLSADVNMQLYRDNGGGIFNATAISSPGYSDQRGREDEYKLYEDLSAGDYMLEVKLASGELWANYDLIVNADRVGNSADQAVNLGDLSGKREVQTDFVGTTKADPVDFYKFTTDGGRERRIYVALRDLQEDANVYLLDGDEKEIASSTLGGTQHELLSSELERNSTYYVKVKPANNSANTNYQLVLNLQEAIATVYSGGNNTPLLTQQGVDYFQARPEFYTTGNIFHQSGWGSKFLGGGWNPENYGGQGTEGNCTWYAHGRVKELGGDPAALNSMGGDADEWHTQLSNGARILRSDESPQVGDIAQWTRNGQKHVAVVEAVNSDGTITVSESHHRTDYDFGGVGTLHRIKSYTVDNPDRYIRVPGVSVDENSSDNGNNGGSDPSEVSLEQPATPGGGFPDHIREAAINEQSEFSNVIITSMGEAESEGSGWLEKFQDSYGNEWWLLLQNGQDTAYWVHGENLGEYQEQGGPHGVLGFPWNNETPYEAAETGTEGVWQGFSGSDGKARIHSGPYGSVATWGSIGSKYTDIGGANSWLGVPTRAEWHDRDGVTIWAEFENGFIANNKQTGGDTEELKPGELPSWKYDTLHQNYEELAKTFAYQDVYEGQEITLRDAIYEVSGHPISADNGFYAFGLEPAEGYQNNPVLVFRGTEPDKDFGIDIYHDIKAPTVGQEQFESKIYAIESWLENNTENNVAPDVIGHSLGGALAQQAAVNFSVGNLVTFNSPGIDKDLVSKYRNKQEKAESIVHYVVQRDVVSWAGDEFLPGKVVKIESYDAEMQNILTKFETLVKIGPIAYQISAGLFIRGLLRNHLDKDLLRNTERNKEELTIKELNEYHLRPFIEDGREWIGDFVSSPEEWWSLWRSFVKFTDISAKNFTNISTEEFINGFARALGHNLPVWP